MLKKIIQLTLIGALFSGPILAKSNVLNRDIGSEPVSLFPPQANDIPSYNVTRDLYEGLVLCDQQGKIIPGVAEKWELDASGKIYTFYLRKSAKWSNGDPVTAKDFVYSWQHLMEPKTASSYAFIMYPVLNAEEINTGKEKDFSKLGVKAIGELTLEVTLKAPTPYFIQSLVHHSFYPIHKASFEKHKEQVARPGNLVSNGSYVLKEWRPQDYILVEKSKHYWDEAHVKIPQVKFFTSENADTTLKRYRAGEVDIIYKIPAEKIVQIQADDKLKKDIRKADHLGTYYYGINLTKEPLKSKKDLREALSLVLDRETICSKITHGGEEPAYRFVPPKTANSADAYVDFKQMPKEDRIKRAQNLFKNAGYSKEKPLKLKLMYNTDESHKKLAIAAAEMWKRTLGVEVELENKEWKVFLEERHKKETTQIFRGGWVGDYNDPYSFLEFMSSTSKMNDLGFENKEFDALLHEAAVTNDLKIRADLMAKAEKILLDTHGLIPVYHYATLRLVSPRVKGYEIGGNNVLDIYYSKDLELAE